MKKKKGFTLVELLCVLVILGLLAILVGKTVIGSINKAKDDLDENQEKSILNAAEKWAIYNSDRFDDIDGSNLTVGLDVVFVVDVSGSMQSTISESDSLTRAEGSVNAINNALEILGINTKNSKNRVGFVFFSGDRDDDEGQTTVESAIKESMPLTSVSELKKLEYLETTEKNEEEETKLYKILFGKDNERKEVEVIGGTYTSLGVRQAMKLFSGSSEGTIPVIILLTDGAATWGADVSESFKLVPSQYGDGSEPNPSSWIKSPSLETTTTAEGHTKITYINSKDQTYSLEYWTVKSGRKTCTKSIEINGHLNGTKTEYDSCLMQSQDKKYTFCNLVSSCYNGYNNFNEYLEGQYGIYTYFYKGWYNEEVEISKNSSKISQNLSKIVWDLTRTSYLAKNALSSMYNATSYFYTIGLGVTSKQGVFMLNPTSENLENLNEPGLFQNTYDDMKDKKDYNYPTKAFTGNMSADELKKIFVDIATEVTEATKVTQICITVDELKQGGYLSKDAKINDKLAKNNYILISENAATNQYVFSIAKTDEQKKACQDLLK